MTEFLQILLFSAAASGAVGLAGWLLLQRTRERSVGATVTLANLTAVLAVVAGVVVTARAMFLSSHDLRVVLLVCLTAGVLSGVLGAALGRQVLAASRSLGEVTVALGEGRSVALPPARMSAELTELRAQLDTAGQRLAEAREREQALEASRRQLVAWVSHDLRTPLAGLRAMAESLQDGVAEDPARYYKQMQVEVERLSSLVDDLFALSRIQAGALRLALEPVSLRDLVADVVAGAEAIARTRGVRLASRVSAGMPLRADERELSRAISNLVVNAVQHTPMDETVEVVAREDSECAVVTVADACGGIPVEELDQLLDVDHRRPSPRPPSRGGGAGLGLVIARGLVEAHGGRISVANSGSGCHFEIRLPLASS